MGVKNVGGGVLHAQLGTVIESSGWTALTRELMVMARRTRASVVKLDLHGVSQLQHEEVNALVNLATTANLLGVDPVLTGLSDAVAGQLARSPFHVRGLLQNAARAA